MKGRRILVGLLTLLSLVALTAAPVLATAVGPYDVTFVTVRYDYPTAGESTWYYTVSSTAGHAISHVVFELGACCSVLDAGLWTDFTTLDSWWGTSKIDVTQDPTTGVFGIKFDDGFDEGETRNYYFTVEGNHAVQEGGITVAIKTGGGSALLMQGVSVLASVTGVLTRGLNLAPREFTTYEASVFGPALDCEQTTAVTLNGFSATSAAGSIAPALFVPGVLLAVGVLVSGGLVLVGRRHRLGV